MPDIPLEVLPEPIAGFTVFSMLHQDSGASIDMIYEAQAGDIRPATPAESAFWHRLQEQS